MLSDKLVTLSYDKGAVTAMLNKESRPEKDLALWLIIIIDIAWDGTSWLELNSTPLLEKNTALQQDVQLLCSLYSDFYVTDNTARLTRSINFFENIERVASPVKRFLRALEKLDPAVGV